MTRLPHLRDELVAAAARLATPVAAPRPRRARRTWLLAAGFAVLLAGSAGAALLSAGVLGGRPSAPYPRVQAEEETGMARTRQPVVLGAGSLPGGSRFELVGYRMRGYGGRGDLLCLDLLLLPKSTSSGSCGPRSRRALGTIGTGTRDDPGPRLAVGIAAPGVVAVDVRWRGKEDDRRRATLVRVPDALAARLKEDPFIYYIAIVPPQARDIVAVALDRDGATLWRAAFSD